MKLNIQQGAFLKGLALCQGIAERKSTMPMLANVMLVTEGESSLVCRATDLYTTITCQIEAKIERPGGVALNAKSLFDIVKNLPGTDIDVQVTENNHVELLSGPSRFRMVGLSAKDYPEIPAVPDTPFDPVPIPVLSNLINRTLFSVSQDETRQHLSGVLVECKGDVIRMVSTDGHRLSKAEEQITGGWPLKENILIPKKGIQELKRMLEANEGTSDLLVKDGMLFARSGSVVLSIRLIDSRFPPYEKVIPASCEKKLVVIRSALMDALKRVSLMSEDRNRGVRMVLEPQKLTIETNTPEVGEAKEDLELDYEGEPLKIGFNAGYLIEALARVDSEEVFLEFNEELDPCVVKPVDSENFLGVVMPLRL
jgi:DNA polymerase III subunit beta